MRIIFAVASLILITGNVQACEYRPLICDLIREVAKGSPGRGALQELEGLAREGDAQAQLTLGMMYGSGKGAPIDEAKALRWFQIAAKGGDRTAQAVLGNFYLSRDAGPQDVVEARKWLELSAQGGEVAAQTTLGILLAKGQGGPVDKMGAYVWFSLAAKGGDKEAEKYAAAMLPELSDDEKTAAQARIRATGGNWRKP